MPFKNQLYEIIPIPVLEDNIIWVWVAGKKAVVVDPSLTKPVQDWLEKEQKDLIAILQTHHHSDHISGTKGLIKSWPKADVIAAKTDLKRIPFQTISVRDGDKISLLGCELYVLEVKGHTNSHIAFFLPQKQIKNEFPALFCGDTLFAGGCGRLFEGTAKDMFKSLQILCSLPKETRVYCAHEYTKNNLEWANSRHPGDKQIKKRLEEVTLLRGKGLLTLPSTIELENSTNLFVRAKSIEEFQELRNDKDHW